MRIIVMIYDCLITSASQQQAMDIRISSFIMGNRNKTFQKHELQYYSTVADGNYSCSEVYTCKGLPMTFIAKLKLNSEDQQLYRRLCEEYSQPSPYLITMYNYSKSKECQCRHFIKDSLVSYWEYYNFTLSSLLDRRIQSKSHFSENEFWHLVMVCCGGYRQLRDSTVYFDFSPERIAVTPEGKVKLFWGHVSMRNTHLNYLNYFESGRKEFIQGYYSPEELKEISINQRNVKLNFEKCNVFSLGMMLLYCLTLLDPIKYFYVIYQVDSVAVQKIIKKRLVNNYSQQVVKLVEACLAPQPKNRADFEEIYILSKDKFVVDSCLNLNIGGTGTTTSKVSSDAELKSKTSRISLRKFKKL